MPVRVCGGVRLGLIEPIVYSPPVPGELIIMVEDAKRADRRNNKSSVLMFMTTGVVHVVPSDDALIEAVEALEDTETL